MQYSFAIPSDRSRSRDGRQLRVASLALMTGITLAIAQAVPAASEATGFIFAADEHGSTLSRVELPTGVTVTTDIAISPHNVQVTPDNQWVLAVGEPGGHNGHGHGHSHESGQLLIFDVTAFADGPRSSIPVGSHPAHVVTEPDGRLAFVTNAGDDSVSVVDLVAGEVTSTISTGAYPHGLRPSPDGTELYVANVQDGSVSLISVEQRSEIARIPVGETPVQVAFTPDGTRVYVSLRDENRVAVIDTASREVIDTIHVGAKPIQVHASVDGERVYVANEGTRGSPGNTVSVIKVASGEVVQTIEVGQGAHGIAVDTAGFVYVTNIHDDSVSVIEESTFSVAATYPVGQGPNGITWANR